MSKPPRTDSWGFNRRSVADQAASVLREAIRKGELTDPLPGEHQLAYNLGISRPSVSAALAMLVSEGLIEVQKGRRSRISARSKKRFSPGQPKVCIVCPVSREANILKGHPVLLEM